MTGLLLAGKAVVVTGAASMCLDVDSGAAEETVRRLTQLGRVGARRRVPPIAS
jgi:hypothetical protein